MKLESIFRSKKHKVIAFTLFFVMLAAFIWLGMLNFNDDLTDAEKFSSEFPLVSSDNVFVYSTASEVLSKLSGDAIILFGSAENDFTESYASIINEIAKECGIVKVLYYDFFSDRTNNNGNYELIVEELTPYLLTDDTGNTELYAPTFLVIKDGFVQYIGEDLNFVSGDITPEDYWSDLQVGTFEATLYAVFNDFIGESE